MVLIALVLDTQVISNQQYNFKSIPSVDSTSPSTRGSTLSPVFPLFEFPPPVVFPPVLPPLELVELEQLEVATHPTEVVILDSEIDFRTNYI